MLHDKIHEKHKLTNKFGMTSIHIKIYVWAHEQKFNNKIPITWIYFMLNQNMHKPINKYDYLSTIEYCTLWHIDPPKLLLCLCVVFYSSFVYTCVTVCVFLHIQSPLRECRSIWSGASGLPYYFTPLVCVSVVMELLAMWWHNKLKTK